MSRTNHARTRRAAASALGATAVAASAAAGVAVLGPAAQAGEEPVAAGNPLVLSVSDEETYERYVIEDPNCPPDIICRPLRAPGKIVFKVKANLSFADRSFTVKYRTVDDTAVAPADYAAGSGSLTFTPGVFVKTVTVPVHFNTAIEPTETFFLELHSPSVPADTGDRGIATILDGTSNF